MKRVLKIVALVVLVLGLSVAAILAYTFMGMRAVVDGQEIGGIRIVADGFTSLAIVPIDERQVVLIDAGEDEAGEAVLQELLRRQLGPDAVSAILLTHGHPDHTGAIRRFPNAQVMAIDAEVALVEGREGSRGPITRFFSASPTGVTVARALRDGDVVTIGQVPIRVYAVPGHTPGSAAFLVNGVLFVGDSANVASDGRLLASPWIFTESRAGNRASLARLEQRLVEEGARVTAIVPSHSGMAEGLAPLTAFARAYEGD